MKEERATGDGDAAIQWDGRAKEGEKEEDIGAGGDVKLRDCLQAAVKAI